MYKTKRNRLTTKINNQLKYNPYHHYKIMKKKYKKKKDSKLLTPNKLLAKLPALLAQIKAGNNFYKLNHEIKYYVYSINTVKQAKEFTTIL